MERVSTVPVMLMRSTNGPPMMNCDRRPFSASGQPEARKGGGGRGRRRGGAEGVTVGGAAVVGGGVPVQEGDAAESDRLDDGDEGAHV